VSDHPRAAKDARDKLDKQMENFDRTSSSVKDNGDLYAASRQAHTTSFANSLLQKTPGSLTD
jgi:hypothetical protein